MSQPLDRTCKIEPLGKIDEAAGEFWTHPFAMPQQGDNLSAYETNSLFLNVDGSRFLDASFASKANIDSDSRSVMVADFNADRAPDLLVGSVGGGPLRLFLNRFPAANHRVEFRLRGVKSNHRGIGSRAIVEAGGRTIVRDLFSPNGFMGQSPASLNVGVGTAERIDTLTIRWPTGEKQVFRDLPVDCTIEIVEESDEFRVVARDDSQSLQ
ncbi:MAG: ASPIC/UnbV domain-containing protein [Planctomycetaceae bacterium]